MVFSGIMHAYRREYQEWLDRRDTDPHYVGKLRQAIEGDLTRQLTPLAPEQVSAILRTTLYESRAEARKLVALDGPFNLLAGLLRGDWEKVAGPDDDAAADPGPLAGQALPSAPGQGTGPLAASALQVTWPPAEPVRERGGAGSPRALRSRQPPHGGQPDGQAPVLPPGWPRGAPFPPRGNPGPGGGSLTPGPDGGPQFPPGALPTH